MYIISTRIESFSVVDGVVEVVKSQPVQTMVCTLSYPNLFAPQVSRRVWKEIYRVKDGKIVLSETVEAMIFPAQEERWEFGDGK